MKIGNVETKNNVFLAPMAGITDLPFRAICREYGCGMVYSEMVSAKGLFYKSENTKKLLETNEEERPVAVQMFGSVPEIMAEMAQQIEQYPIDIIDINMGCPAPKIVKNGEGSALMLKPKLVGEIVRAVSDAIKKPVTVKFRKGFDNSNINAVEIAEIAEQNGASAVAVHGRTTKQYYSGNADWDIIRQVKERVSIPVIGNGDVDSPEKAEQLFKYTGCDAVMIGRGAQGNPWIFQRTVKYLETGVIPPLPTISERLDVLIKHIAMLCEYKGEYIGIREARKHLGWYTKAMPDSTRIRAEANQLESREQILRLIDNYRCSL